MWKKVKRSWVLIIIVLLVGTLLLIIFYLSTWKEYRGDKYSYRIPKDWDTQNLVQVYKGSLTTNGMEVLSEASNVDFSKWPEHLPFPGFHSWVVLYRHKKVPGAGIFDKESGFEDYYGGIKLKFWDKGLYISPKVDSFYFDVYYDNGDYIYEFDRRPIVASNVMESLYYELISSLVVFSFRPL